MIMQYGNFAYFFYPIVIVLITAALCLFLRNRTQETKKYAVLALMLIKFAQHVLKRFLYPAYRGAEFDLRLSTAYNLCALLILSAPVILLGNSSVGKDFFVLFGVNAGVVSMAFPYWYIGQSLWQWEVFRFYVCHGLLFASALLIPLLGLHRPAQKNFWKLPFLFFFALILVTFNDIVVWVIQGARGDLWQMLSACNPCWLFHPDEHFSRLLPLIAFFSPDRFLGNAATGQPFTPLLWYFVPMYLLIAGLAFLICSLIPHRRSRPARFRRPHT